jgi:class 3 adenylate cyclase
VPAVLRPGGQVLVLTNDHSEELVVRVERTARRSDALTAARASSLALFRELFPDEVLSPGQLMSVATVTLLVTDLEGSATLYHNLGDARAFAVIHEHFRLVGDAVRAEGGAPVKTVGEGLVAAFPDAAAAVRAALELHKALVRGEGTAALKLRAGVHRGPALAATVNDQLDYFGTTVRRALALPALARVGECVLTREVAADPEVDALLRARGLTNEVFEAELPDAPASVLHRLKPG